MRKSRFVFLGLGAIGIAAHLFCRDSGWLETWSGSHDELQDRTGVPKVQRPHRPHQGTWRRNVPKFVVQPEQRAFPGLPVYSPHDPGILFSLETRDTVWAPAMEEALGRTLSAASLSSVGLTELNVREVSCRQTTCKVVYDFPSRLVDLVTATGYPPASPLILLEEKVGRPAPRSGGFESERSVRKGEPYLENTVIFGFDADSWDPTSYSSWVQGQLPATREFFERARSEWGSRNSIPPGRSSPMNSGEDAG